MSTNEKVGFPTTEKRAKFIGITIFKDVVMDNGETDRANINWSMRNEYPRLTVYTSKYVRDKDGKMDYSKVVIAPFDLISAKDFVKDMKKVMANKEERVLHTSVYCYYPKYVNDQKTNEKEIKAIVKFGRNSEGIYYISVKGKDKPEAIFEMLKSEWCVAHDSKDVPQESSIIRSRKYAMSYIELLDHALNNAVIGPVNVIDKKSNKPVTKASSADINSIIASL